MQPKMPLPLQKITLDQCQAQDDWKSVMKHHFPKHEEYKPHLLGKSYFIKTKKL